MKTCITILIFLFGGTCYAQTTTIIKRPIHLSGVLVSGDSLKGVPMATIKIVKTDSMDYSYFFSVPTDKDGLFSLNVRPGDVIEFKKSGYVDSRYTTPHTLTKEYTSIIQITMQRKENSKDTSVLLEVLPKK